MFAKINELLANSHPRSHAGKEGGGLSSVLGGWCALHSWQKWRRRLKVGSNERERESVNMLPQVIKNVG